MKRLDNFFKNYHKTIKESKNGLQVCINKNCGNDLNNDEVEKLRKEYVSDLKKECKDSDYKCMNKYYKKSNYKKVLDTIEKCTKDYCLDNSYKILKNSKKFFNKTNTLKIEKLKCLKEYLESNDTSKKNIDKYVKKCKLVNKQELLYDLEPFKNNIKLVEKKIKELEQKIKSEEKECINLDKKINKYKPKTIKKSIKKKIKQKIKKSKKKIKNQKKIKKSRSFH